jgi:hypothetical protein
MFRAEALIGLGEMELFIPSRIFSSHRGLLYRVLAEIYVLIEGGTP